LKSRCDLREEMKKLKELDIDKIKDLMLKDPHDTYFKYALQDHELARQFIEYYVPENIKKTHRYSYAETVKKFIYRQRLAKKITQICCSRQD